ncbi:MULTISPECIES: energy transducer TonB [unclassified Novosphingobium]|uniref:energy transducer TonB family protein n=1 Tax=unclassified Novosphingobium TaxID=2644732 RepID=UPI001359F42B|nr:MULTISPECIES: energy transducer TonB [unclassified Novosphingobium]
MPSSTLLTARESGSAEESDRALALQRRRSAYRVGSRGMRMMALGATVLVHMAVGAMVAIGWQRTENVGEAPHLASVIIVPRAADEPRRRQTSGAVAPVARPEPLPVISSPPPTILLAPPVPAVVEAAAELPVAAEGGREDALAMATQAYRRVLMARLEAERRHVQPHRGGGAGTVVFRVERSGRLLEASVVQSTGRRALDRAALALVRGAAPFPAIPDALPDELAITLPVEFLIGDRSAMVAGQ